MSSRVGSIEDNTSGGMYAYRSSKAALNSICRSLAMDLKDKGVVVVIMHPGYVKTGLDPDTHSMDEAVEPDEAASKLWKVLTSKNIEETGRFWHREGQELPW
jgi:NAD(P)-dependent dehydrogenase (short-subunit alcohol dehydrogenase family)